MKRTLGALVASVAGLVVLLGFKSMSGRPAGLPVGAAAAGGQSNTGSSSATATSGAPPSGKAQRGGGAQTTSPVAPTNTRTVNGKSVSTRYGAVQVQITLAGNRITAVTPVKLPDSNSIDQAIDQQVVPLLIQESLTAQSAHIDAISGATYTSDGYIRSLQSALDKAKA